MLWLAEHRLTQPRSSLAALHLHASLFWVIEMLYQWEIVDLERACLASDVYVIQEEHSYME